MIFSNSHIVLIKLRCNYNELVGNRKLAVSAECNFIASFINRPTGKCTYNTVHCIFYTLYLKVYKKQ